MAEQRSKDGWIYERQADGRWRRMGQAPSQSPDASQTIVTAPPPRPAPQTPAQLRRDENAAAASAYDPEFQRLKVEEQRLKNEAATRDALTKKEEEAKIGELRQRDANLRTLADQLVKAQSAYDKNFRGGWPNFIAGNIPSADQAEFDKLASTLVDSGQAAFRIPGSGDQGEKELALKLKAYQPSASSSDKANDVNFDYLRSRVNTERETLGLQPIDWDALRKVIEPQPAQKAGTQDRKTILQGGSPFTPSPGGLEVDVSEEVGPGHPDYERMKAAQDRRDELARQTNAMRNAIGGGGAQSLFGQGAMFGIGDEATGIGGGIGSVLTGGAFPQGYTTFRDIERGRLDDARNKTGWLGTAAELGGAAVSGALPFGAAGQLTRGAQALQGLRMGAGTGALAGFGYGEGAADSGGGALTGALVGGGLGAAGGALFGRQRLPPQITPEQRAIVNAAQAEGVRISRPIADETRRGAMGYLESTIGGHGPVTRSLRNTADDLEARAGALGGGRGTVQEQGVLGSIAQGAGQRFIDRSRDVGGRLYERAAAAAGNNRVRGAEAVRVLDENLADLSANPNANAPLINYLRDLRADFVDDAGQIIPKDIGSIRDLRTSMRGQISARNLTASDAERRVGMVLDAARGDIARDLGRSAPNAVRLYDRADDFWRQRSSEIKQVVERVIGPRDNPLGGEAVFARLKAMAAPGGDSARLRRVVDKMTPEERADYASTVAASLGRRSPDEDFSPALFISGARALSPGARRVIFGADGARSIENLRLVAEGLRGAEQALNRSRSGAVLNWANTLRNLIAPGSGAGIGTLVGGPVGGLAGAAVGAGMTGAGIGMRNLSARALMNPDLTRWLATGTRLRTPAQISAHIRRLSTVAGRAPGLQSEIQALQQGLINFANDNAGGLARGAASGGDEIEDRDYQRRY